MRLEAWLIDTAGASNGNALVYDAASDEYKPGTPAGVQSVVAGTGVSVDSTDPAHPVVSLVPGSSAYREVLMASGVSFPADYLESSSGGDLLYGEAP